MNRKGKLGIAAGAILLTAGIGSAIGGNSSSTAAPSSHPVASTSQPNPGYTSAADAPAPVYPDPKLTAEGSSDYQLSDNYDSGVWGWFTSEVTVHNTGNVGTTAKVTVKWHQFGGAPVVAHKTVRVPYGATKTVQFKVPVGSEQIDAIQSYESAHDYDNSLATYRVVMGHTFGQAHG